MLPRRSPHRPVAGGERGPSTMILEGLLAGAGHVASGPDHWAGVAPLVAGRARPAHSAWVGATWGLGHGLGVGLLGALGQTLLDAAQVELASGWAERLVGLVLIVFGVLSWRRARGLVLHEHVHEHDGEAHRHLHVHAPGQAPAKVEGGAHGRKHDHGHAAFGMGLLHGLAGAGHFWAVLPSLAMPPRAAAVYIASYVVASLLLMTAFGALLGHLGRRFDPVALPRFVRAVALLTCAVGLAWTASAFGLV